MGLFGSLGKDIGSLVGGVMGGAVSLVGDITGSSTIKEAGMMACAITTRTGETLGRLADGAATCVGGVISGDSGKARDGLSEVVYTTVETASGMGRGLANTVRLAGEGIGAVCDGDTERAVKVGKTFVKIGIAGAASFGILDIIDGVPDGVILDFNHNGVPDFLEHSDGFIENPNMHHVSPHWRTLPEGRRIWVDGDGNTAINTAGGWWQSNPNYRA